MQCLDGSLVLITKDTTGFSMYCTGTGDVPPPCNGGTSPLQYTGPLDGNLTTVTYDQRIYYELGGGPFQGLFVTVRNNSDKDIQCLITADWTNQKVCAGQLCPEPLHDYTYIYVSANSSNASDPVRFNPACGSLADVKSVQYSCKY